MENGVGTSKAMRLMITTVSSMLSQSLPWRFWGRTIDNLPSMGIGNGHSASVGPHQPADTAIPASATHHTCTVALGHSTRVAPDQPADIPSGKHRRQSQSQ